MAFRTSFIGNSKKSANLLFIEDALDIPNA
jgi:hypothetical protein